MNYLYEHRSKHNLDIPYECEGFFVDEYVGYIKNNQYKKGYIYCFRKFGYNWFAWLYFDKSKIKPVDGVFVSELKKVKE